MSISVEVKKKCVELAKSGMPSGQIYREYFSGEHTGMSLKTFKRKLFDWKRRKWPDTITLEGGTYEGFTAHGATVQVNAQGEIVQAWIKQAVDDGQWDRLLEVIHENTEPIEIQPREGKGDGMLEIPLVDMHFPLSDHRGSIEQILSIINQHKWEEINLVVGQDMFHNDDMRGRTASGRAIEKVDIPLAWNMAKEAWYSIAKQSLLNSDKVNLIYSVGNHDESLAWAFVQLMKDHFPQIRVDDRLKQRKCISWRKCFIGLTHGHYAKSTNQDLRGQFTIEYPMEFAEACVREIHAGHLHTEKEGDLYGVMVRRLSRNGETDQWSEDEGYVGSIKRFMVFEWAPGQLKAIYYV